MNVPEKITRNLKLFDYVTTTTEIFANKIKKYNENVLVFPNAIDPNEEQYKPIKNPSNRIRFGFVMGSAHEKDMEQFKGVVNSLPQDVKDKIQIVLCGYDLRGTVNLINQDGTLAGKRPIKPTESVWFSYERTCTNDYKECSPEYRDFLFKFLKNVQWPNVENELYRREWTKDVSEFAKHYRNLDVLFAPLDCNGFNEVKSELKFIEAGFTNTAVICTDFGPYTIGSKSLFTKGGEINEDGNCILIDPRKKHKDWKRAIVKLANNPEYIDLLKKNLHETVKDKYNIENVTKTRAEWYKSIVKK
jgi:glycosyltransferase involved in cell wall biosynthesis